MNTKVFLILALVDPLVAGTTVLWNNRIYSPKDTASYSTRPES